MVVRVSYLLLTPVRIANRELMPPRFLVVTLGQLRRPAPLTVPASALKVRACHCVTAAVREIYPHEGQQYVEAFRRDGSL